ncbi:RHS repeat-associated core domain-containing protein [Verrucomicrobiaceae bacterium R5-34]|nr:RHS repeat-associated core domain-containing protein [Verrucomicrobiaceae bacterium R5-34]
MNQYTKANGVSLPVNAYDDDGNLTVAPLPVDQNTNVLYHWDAENRLVKITSLDETTTIAEYSYDYLGRRISKQSTVNSQLITVHWIYDGWNLAAELTGTTLAKTYTWGMDLSGSMQGAGGVGGLLSVNDGTSSYYPTYDGNGNVSEYLDSTGTVQAHYEYDAFGNTVVGTGTKVNDYDHRFSTKPHDAETGLYYYGYRYYDPVTGRWPSRDPIEERGGVNLYGFVENNGITRVDVLGLVEIKQLKDKYVTTGKGTGGSTKVMHNVLYKVIQKDKKCSVVLEKIEWWISMSVQSTESFKAEGYTTDVSKLAEFLERYKTNAQWYDAINIAIQKNDLSLVLKTEDSVKAHEMVHAEQFKSVAKQALAAITKEAKTKEKSFDTLSVANTWKKTVDVKNVSSTIFALEMRKKYKSKDGMLPGEWEAVQKEIEYLRDQNR